MIMIVCCGGLNFSGESLKRDVLSAHLIFVCLIGIQAVN